MCTYRKQGELPKLARVLSKLEGTATTYKARYQDSDKKAAAAILHKLSQDSGPKFELASITTKVNKITI